MHILYYWIWCTLIMPSFKDLDTGHSRDDSLSRSLSVYVSLSLCVSLSLLLLLKTYIPLIKPFRSIKEANISKKGLNMHYTHFES